MFESKNRIDARDQVTVAAAALWVHEKKLRQGRQTFWMGCLKFVMDGAEGTRRKVARIWFHLKVLVGGPKFVMDGTEGGR